MVLSQAVATTWNALTQWTAVANLSQTVTSTWSILNQWSAITVLAQSLSTSWSILPQAAFTLEYARSATFTWITETIRTIGAINYVADFSLTVTAVWNLLTQWTAIANFSQE